LLLHFPPLLPQPLFSFDFILPLCLLAIEGEEAFVLRDVLLKEHLILLLSTDYNNQPSMRKKKGVKATKEGG
jgi:hypothetical protein